MSEEEPDWKSICLKLAEWLGEVGIGTAESADYHPFKDYWDDDLNTCYPGYTEDEGAAWRIWMALPHEFMWHDGMISYKPPGCEVKPWSFHKDKKKMVVLAAYRYVLPRDEGDKKDWFIHNN